MIKITACNRGSEDSTLHFIPTLWFRNTWSLSKEATKPEIKRGKNKDGTVSVITVHPETGCYQLTSEGDPKILFTENETNNSRIFGTQNNYAHVKDAFHEFIIGKKEDSINPENTGTKAGFWYSLTIPANGEKTIRLCLEQISDDSGEKQINSGNMFNLFDSAMSRLASEADNFYKGITPPSLNDDQKQIIRQALSGMLWNKQYYFFDLDLWLSEHGNNHLFQEKFKGIRNKNWYHMLNDDIISMPDKWEYPWFAAWDLAFHTLALKLVDPVFASEQLKLMLREVYLHPSGQIPAYEWNFSDVNPPVHAYAALTINNTINLFSEDDNNEFLKEIFNKLLLNFTWWVNRKDPDGRNIYEGGFLGLDNIGVFDRSAPLPTGGFLEQADGTAWMAFFCQNMLEISLILAEKDPVYENMAVKFFEHFMWIAASMDKIGEQMDELWDEEDGFYYDVLNFPDGQASRIKVNSLVGLLPLCSTTILEKSTVEKFPEGINRIIKFLKKHPELESTIAPPDKPGVEGRFILSVLSEGKLRRILARMLDEKKFLSPYGIRSLSRSHLDNPFIFNWAGNEYKVAYEPGESESGLFGGNSNWRGPIWFPINILIIRALFQSYLYYGNEFQVECPTGSGIIKNLFEIAEELSSRLISIFTCNAEGKRPVFGTSDKFQSDDHWKDYLLFYEYFHGESGAGLGASHQTGWTGMVAYIIQLFGHLDSQEYLKYGNIPAIRNFFKDQQPQSPEKK